jgi:ribosomal protein S1
MRLKGTVTRTELYGAFVDLGLEREGLVHISRMSDQRVKKVTDVVNVGDEVKVWVLSVDPGRGRIALTLVEPPDVTWDELKPGKMYTGEVTRIERYGVFVDIGAERPGLLHVREMGQYVRDPADFARMGETVEVKILNVDRRKRQIDFTTQMDANDYLDEGEDTPMLSAMEIAFQQARAQSEGRKSRSQKARSQHSDSDMDDIYRRTLQHGK